MDGFSITGLSRGSDSARTKISDSTDGSVSMPRRSVESGPGDTPPAALHTAVDSAVCDIYEDDPPAFTDNEEVCLLSRSFDIIFQLQQRSEEIRSNLDRVDRLLLKSRTVEGLVQKLIAALESDFNLTAARILFRPDHPFAELLKRAAPRGAGIAPPGFIEPEGLFSGAPFVLNEPNGDLSRSLFDEGTPLLSSAIVANLCVDGSEVGLLCLGSDDPNRYREGMNTGLIASLADKIALGIQNAWDHESRARKSLVGRVEGIYCESFFREYLAKEFHRSWRSRNVFSLVAICWPSSPTSPTFEEIAAQIRAQLRASDVAAEDDSARLWILLPGTDIDGGSAVAERLSRSVAEEFDQEVMLHFGITAFSSEATSVHTLMNRAQAALTEAVESGSSGMMVRI
jgi:uncharacterized protein YigA (DUF484 family)